MRSWAKPPGAARQGAKQSCLMALPETLQMQAPLFKQLQSRQSPRGMQL
jgi:hypothetical protein